MNLPKLDISWYLANGYITADDYDYEYVDEEKIFDIEKLKEYFENHLEDFTYDRVLVDYDDLEDINAD